MATQLQTEQIEEGLSRRGLVQALAAGGGSERSRLRRWPKRVVAFQA